MPDDNIDISQGDLFAAAAQKKEAPKDKKKDSNVFQISKQQQRLIIANGILNEWDEDPDILFNHSILCNVGLPRKKVEGHKFIRTNGNASLILTAPPQVINGKEVFRPLPYGTTPRLIMYYISTEAVKTKSRLIDIGENTRQFLTRLGIDTNGGPRGGYTRFQYQMNLFSNAHMDLSWTNTQEDGRTLHNQVTADPVASFKAWLSHDDTQLGMWPAELQLSETFYETLINHAVPLRDEAVSAIKKSSLALDIYNWLAHRLPRVNPNKPLKLSHNNLYEQFGQEYIGKNGRDNFKKTFRKELDKVRLVYPSGDRAVKKVAGGYLFYQAAPPIHNPIIQVRFPKD